MSQPISRKWSAQAVVTAPMIQTRACLSMARDASVEGAGGVHGVNARGRDRLRVLIVSHWFPPSNVIGAVRVGKFAHHLHKAGHDVRILTVADPSDRSLPLELPAELVTHVSPKRRDDIFDPIVGLVRRMRTRQRPASAADSRSSAAFSAPQLQSKGLRAHYYALLQIPDKNAGWMKAAIQAGRAIVSDWRPDVVFGSAPPVSGLIVAHRIARLCGVPWIAELRDLWADNIYYEFPRWRYWIDRLIERSALGNAAGLVTVSPIWAEMLHLRYRQPIACVMNGYVEEDYPEVRTQPPPGEVVSIVYTGNIYSGYRDPSPLFRAIALLGPERNRIAVHFYGPIAEEVCGLPAAQGVQGQIHVHERVSYRSSLALQTQADVLLLLQWADARDAGNIPAKFFEYIGARRPILMIGYERGNLAELIRERDAGLVANDPAVIAEALRRWIAQRSHGIPPVDPRARYGMTRAEQFAKLEQFLTALSHAV